MNKNSILITGATGLLGSTLVPWLNKHGNTVVTHARSANADFVADLANKDEAYALLDRLKPTTIVNLVSLTSVEFCQEKPNAAYLANSLTVENLVHWIQHSGATCHLVQISTDQVYDGVGPHTESLVTLTNYYAYSKYAGELAAARVPSTILRTNFFGRSRVSYRESISDWIFRSLTHADHIQVLSDVFFSPLSMTTLAEMIYLVIEKKPVGIFNLASHDGMSKADFDFAFAEHLGLPTSTMTCIEYSKATFLKTYRPKDMRMDCSKFENALGVKLPLLRDEIRRAADEYLEVI